MTRLKSDDIWKDWLTVSEGARQPREAPRSAESRARLSVGMAALASVVVIVAVVGSRLMGPSVSPGSTPSTSPTTTLAQSSPTSSPSAASSSSLEPSSPTPGLSAATFTTLGIKSNWRGFSWSQLPSDSPLVTADPGTQVLTWRGGFVAYGTTNGGSSSFVWTSVDGQRWRQITAIVAPQVLVAVSPTGLVAIAGDPTSATPSETVWTSSDGVQWHNAGSPAGLAFVDSLAGTSTGLVAVQHTLTGSGKFATSQYSVAHSSDGVSWTPVTVGEDLSWIGHVMRVQSGDNRFFLMGAAPDPADSRGAIGIVLWSDDGRTWARSTGAISWPAIGLEFGRDGILLHTNSLTTGGGGVGLDRSTDGGKTWQPDDTFGPLGIIPCGQGECGVSPDGVIASNGTVFLAVKNDGHAWVSYDGRTWTPIAWNAPASISSAETVLVLPCGVVVGNAYGAAK